MNYSAADVTLYIPYFNAQATIIDCLDSALKQSSPASRVFIINDGSEQPLPELPANVEVIDHPKNLGLAAGRNTALKNCKTTLLAAIDADVLLASNWLEEMLNCLNKHSDKTAGIGGKMIEKNCTDLADQWRAKHMAQHWGDKEQINPRFLFGANTLFRVDALKEAGGFDERCRTNNEDATISQALYDSGYDLVYTPSAKAEHLRKDDLQSIIPAYWGWHHMKGIQEGDYDSVEGLIGRIERVNFGIGKYRYELDQKDGDEQFLELDSLISTIFCIRDLKLFCQRNEPYDFPNLVPFLSNKFTSERYNTYIKDLLPKETQVQTWQEKYLTEWINCS